MATFVVHKHLVTILFTDFTNPDSLTYDLLLLNSLNNSVQKLCCIAPAFFLPLLFRLFPTESMCVFVFEHVLVFP